MTDVLLLTFIFLIAGVVAVPIASRLGLGSVLGYLIAGILISPLLSFLHVDVVSIQHFAEFGVVMMLFLVGLELEPKLLWEMRSRLLGLGGGQVGVTVAAVTAIAMLFGQPWTVALAIGLVFSLSSTAIVLQTLNEKGLMKSEGGQSSFSVLLFQDIAVIPMLALIPLLAMPELMDSGAAMEAIEVASAGVAGTEDQGGGMSLVDGLAGWQRTLITIGAIAAVVFAGNYLTGPIFRFISQAKLRELFTATALMMIVGIALLMTLVGLSPALGTFLAGVVLANSDYRHELESDIEPFKGLLLGLFFMTVGAGINFGLLSENLMLVVGLTLGLILLKALVVLVLTYVFKIKGADRWLFALGLAQAGEFGFVLLSFTVANSVIPIAVADQLLLVVALSMILTPALFILYDRVIAPKFSVGQTREHDEITERNHIIVAGHGRVGGLVNRMLSVAGFKATVIDFSSRQLDLISKFGMHAYFGDATRPDILHSAGIDEAKVLIVAIDGKDQITKLVKHAIHQYPYLHVIARALDREHVYELWEAGCRDIIRETYDSSIRMGRSTYEALGIEESVARKMSYAFEGVERSSIAILAEYRDPDVPAAENKAYQAKVRELGAGYQKELKIQMDAIRQEGTSGSGK
ncbi:MAG: CPA2 family monovalent cation:H+ antiporter-2 [Porticoccaceae bacterium]|jgi:CPA2 family monovalent cation:H+ antiporter-2